MSGCSYLPISLPRGSCQPSFASCPPQRQSTTHTSRANTLAERSNGSHTADGPAAYSSCQIFFFHLLSPLCRTCYHFPYLFAASVKEKKKIHSGPKKIIAEPDPQQPTKRLGAQLYTGSTTIQRSRNCDLTAPVILRRPPNSSRWPKRLATSFCFTPCAWYQSPIPATCATAAFSPVDFSIAQQPSCRSNWPASKSQWLLPHAQ